MGMRKPWEKPIRLGIVEAGHGQDRGFAHASGHWTTRHLTSRGVPLSTSQKGPWMDQVHQNWKNMGKKHGKKRVHLRKMLEFTRKHGKTVQVFIEKVGDFTWDKAPKAWEIQCIQWIARFYGDTHWYQWGCNQQIWQSTDWFKGKSCRKRCEITIKQWDSGKDFPSNNNLKLPLRSPRKHTKRYGKNTRNVDRFLRRNNGYIYI